MKQFVTTVPPPAALDTPSNAIADGPAPTPLESRQDNITNSYTYVNSTVAAGREHRDPPTWPGFLNPTRSAEHRDRPIAEEELTKLWAHAEHEVRKLARHRLRRISLHAAYARAGGAGEHARMLPSASSVRAGLLADRQLIDDVVQDVGIALLLAVRRGALRASVFAVRAWLKTVVPRITATNARRRAALMFAAGRDPNEQANDVDASDAHEARARRDDSRSAEAAACEERIAAKLKPREREALRLWLEGRTHSEIARTLRTTASNARVVLHRARHNARKALALAAPQRKLPPSKSHMRLLLLACACISLPACLDLPKPEVRAVTAQAVVLDLSTSTSGASDERCDELIARVRRTLSTPGVRRLDITALGTGDASTGLEPIVLVPWSRWEPSARLYEQPGKAEAEREAWIESIASRCRVNARGTNASPVYAAIARGAESIRARCADVESRRERCERRMLAVHSDLRENGEGSIAAALRAATRGRRGKSRAQGSLPRLDLADMALSICGVSDTRAAGEEYVAPDALRDVWKAVLGAGIPAFDAACPEEGAR